MLLSSRGGHSHRRRVQSCDRGQDAVKRSRHFLGVGQTVKQHYLRHYWRSRGVADPFAHAQLIYGQGSRVKGKNPAWSSGQGRFSTVKNLDPGRSSGHGTYGSSLVPRPHPLRGKRGLVNLDCFLGLAGSVRARRHRCTETNLGSDWSVMLLGRGPTIQIYIAGNGVLHSCG